jgi:hypothetical protein
MHHALCKKGPWDGGANPILVKHALLGFCWFKQALSLGCWHAPVFEKLLRMAALYVDPLQWQLHAAVL